MSVTLRPYQVEACEATLDTFQRHTGALLVMATGCGKTRIFADLASRWPCGFDYASRVLILAHEEELVGQAVEKLQECGLEPAVEMACHRADERAWFRSKVVVASVPTLSRQDPETKRRPRLEKFDPKEFGLIVADEAHHSLAPSWRAVFNHFTHGNPRVKILGPTATPRRSDELSLGQVYTAVAYEYDIDRAIPDGYLVPVVQRVIRDPRLDYSKVRLNGKDLSEKDLDELLSQDGPLHAVAFPALEEAGDRQTLVFASGVRHADLLAEALNERKPGCAVFLSGDTRPEYRQFRRASVADFKAGRLQMLSVCGLFREGFDAPATSVIVMARPTKSLGLYMQQLGRGTRPLPGVVDGLPDADARREAIFRSAKSCMYVLDFVGNSGRHKIVSAADALGGKYGEPVRKRAAELAEEGAHAGKPVQQLLEYAADELALLEEIAQRRRDQAELERRRQIAAQARVHYTAEEVSPFVGGQVMQAPPAPTRRDPATPKQIDYLEVLGVPRHHSEKWSRGQAGAVISKKLAERNAARAQDGSGALAGEAVA